MGEAHGPSVRAQPKLPESGVEALNDAAHVQMNLVQHTNGRGRLTKRYVERQIPLHVYGRLRRSAEGKYLRSIME